ncbi:MAG: HTH-type transcriptional activator CmpR [Paracidovorax wautersii]|uniref:HTH-type transcriptional activator CmpR n=1 Tax=Paracidovorax wautersii TaxID=1177982 RepID=A0A7V8JS73_9BURK|nr:MAG: HTH-type transcriptional activator CmpR [Paracidovorax wautersii]
MINYLQTLAAVARYGTFVAAGDRLGLTQSAVSIQMRRLEETLGIQLFDRSRRTAVLTEEGRRALGHAEKIVELFGQMVQGVDDANLTGALRAGAITTELIGNVVGVMAAFRARFPNVEVHLTPGASTELLAMVEKQQIDCALIVKPAYPLEGALHWRPLRQEPFVLIAPPRETRRDAAWLLANRPFIRYDRRSHGGSLVERFLKRKKYAPREAIETDSIEAIGLLVARGLGISILPRTAALQVMGARVQEIGLGVDTFYREIGLVERTDNPRAALNGELWLALQQAAAPAAGPRGRPKTKPKVERN